VLKQSGIEILYIGERHNMVSVMVAELCSMRVGGFSRGIGFKMCEMVWDSSVLAMVRPIVEGM